MATRVAGKFESSARVTPANAISLLRVAATPVMILLIVDVGVAWVSVVVWLGLSCTDFVDGWVARRQGATTSGAFLDPLADKFLVLGALAALAAGGLTSWLPVAIIAAREVLISVYRSVVARRGISVPARPVAKAKTAVQDVAICLLLLPGVGDRHGWIGRDLLWLAVVLAVVSAAQYLLDSRHSGPAGRTGAATDKGSVSTTGRVG
jgi:CDP-diacylglycerol---glycerol-3-phosphate 3-phosphatidyltransferase